MANLSRSQQSLKAHGTDWHPAAPLTDEEVKALQIIHLALKQSPQSYTLLHVQCDFLRGKSRLDWALQLAKEAVNCAPSEFVTWAKLTEVYIEMGEYENVSVAISSFLHSLHADRSTFTRLSSRSTPARCSHTTSETSTACRRPSERTPRYGSSSPSRTSWTRRAHSTTRYVRTPK